MAAEGHTVGCDCPADGIEQLDQHAELCSYRLAVEELARPRASSPADLASKLESEALELLVEGAKFATKAAMDDPELSLVVKQQMLVADAHARAALSTSIRLAGLEDRLSEIEMGVRS